MKTTEERIAEVESELSVIAILMNSFEVDENEYVNEYHAWLDSTRDGVMFFGKWIPASTAIKIAMPDEYAMDLKQFALTAFQKDKLTSAGYEMLVDDWIELFDELKLLKTQLEQSNESING